MQLHKISCNTNLCNTIAYNTNKIAHNTNTYNAAI